jgi:ribosomal protein S18 acetylase RimI-like enzyme
MIVFEDRTSKDNEGKSPTIRKVSSSFQLSENNLESFSKLNDQIKSTIMKQINEQANENKLIFKSKFNYGTFVQIKNSFSTLFKVVYPDEFFENVNQNKKYKSIIAFDKTNNDLIGYSHIKICEKKKAEILTLGVLKEHQNKHYGSQILSKVIEELTILGIKEINLFVQESNLKAIQLYKKYGFDLEKKIENYYFSFKEPEDKSAFCMKLNFKNQEWNETF